MMNLKKLLLSLFVFSFTLGNITAQEDKITHQFKKGEIIDFLFLTTKPDKAPLFKDYRKYAYPVASAFNYQSLMGFYIKEYTQGNTQPEKVVFGKWPDRKTRESFLNQLDSLLPELRQKRREIWSDFKLTYYEMKEDFTFEVHKDKFTVVTLYWEKNGQRLTDFKSTWTNKSTAHGGRIIAEFIDGTSPFEYRHDPDWLVITEWKDRADFEKFHKENLKMNHETIEHVEEFILNY